MRKSFVFLLMLAALAPNRAPASFVNLSTRVEIPQPFLGEDITAVIGGFIIGGNNGRKILVRALGPSLVDFGLVPLPDPTLELHDGTGAIIATNDNWMDTQEDDILATSLAPSNSLEAAILITVPPGSYTAIVRGNPGESGALTSGTTLIEVYVQDLTNPMITGFIVANGGDQTVVVRALGPSLRELGLAGLNDPRLDLYDGQGTLLASNDNWQDTQADDIEATGLAPANEFESAILITLPRGAYTAVLTPVGGAAHGVALAELYKIDG